MKTATLQQLPMQWPDILRWVSNGEEVLIVDHDRTVARVLPPVPPAPDYLARAQTIWGPNPAGKALSDLVGEGRGER